MVSHLVRSFTEMRSVGIDVYLIATLLYFKVIQNTNIIEAVQILYTLYRSDVQTGAR